MELRPSTPSWFAGAKSFNLRCPRNGKTNECFLSLLAQSCIPLSSIATERLEQVLGKAMKVASLARIPANKVNVRLFLKACFRNAHALAGKPVRAFVVDCSS